MARNGSPSLLAIYEESPSEDDSASSEGESSVFPLQRVCNMVVSVVHIVTTALLEETPVPRTIPARPQQAATPTLLPRQLTAHQEGRAVVETKLANLHQHELVLEAGLTTVIKRVERQLLTFTRTN
jgi:hypothetical protein